MPAALESGAYRRRHAGDGDALLRQPIAGFGASAALALARQSTTGCHLRWTERIVDAPHLREYPPHSPPGARRAAARCWRRFRRSGPPCGRPSPRSWVALDFGCDGADERAPDTLVVGQSGEYQGRVPTRLLVATLRVEIDPDDFALLRRLGGRLHHASDPAA